MLTQGEQLPGTIPRPKSDGAIQYVIGAQSDRAFAVASFDLVAYCRQDHAPYAPVNAFDPQLTISQIIYILESVSSQRIIDDQRITANVVDRGCAILLNRR